MKKIGLSLYFLISVIFLQAQDHVPSYGKIDKADLEMKDCEFDPGAEALVLLDIGEIDFSYYQNIGWMSETSYRIRIKILKERAVSRSEIKLRYYAKNGREAISNISGISYNLDANGNIEESKLESRNIYDKGIDKDFSEASFALPNVRAGTVFEYKYKMLRKSYSYIPTWNFQQSIPVRYSAYNVIVPEYFEFTTLNTLRQKMERESQISDEKGGWYMMHNVPGLKDEPYSSGREDFLQRIEFQLSAINMPGFFKNVRTTWTKIIEELLDADEFGGALKKNIKGTGDLDAQLIGKSVKEKTRLIYNYVQRNMQWNEVYGFVTYDGIKSAWDKKNGSITEINFILISLLAIWYEIALPL